MSILHSIPKEKSSLLPPQFETCILGLYSEYNDYIRYRVNGESLQVKEFYHDLENRWSTIMNSTIDTTAGWYLSGRDRERQGRTFADITQYITVEVYDENDLY